MCINAELVYNKKETKQNDCTEYRLMLDKQIK